MSTPRILVDQGGKRPDPPPFAGSPDRAWKWIGWLSLVLALAGLGDLVLVFVPPSFGVAEWEFGTAASVFAGLPLVTIGLAGLLGSALARGKRRQVIAISVVLVLFALVLGGLLLVFVTDVPLAMRAVQGDVLIGVRRAVVKTLLFGVLFSGSYFIAAIGALRAIRRPKGA